MCATELFNLLAIYASVLDYKTNLQCIRQDSRIQNEIQVFLAQNLPKLTASENLETITTLSAALVSNTV